MRYKVYTFDFDYTLGDATKGIVESVNYALRNMNLPEKPTEQIRQTVGMTLQDTFTYLTKNEDQELRTRFVRLFKERADEVMTQNTELFEDTIHVLGSLRAKGAGLGISTTKYRYRIIDILKKFEISNFIDVIVGGDDVKNPKPDPEALTKALNMFNCTKEDAVYIGDSIIDAKTANSAKVDFIAVTTGTTKRSEFIHLPHIAIIDSLSDLLNLDLIWHY